MIRQILTSVITVFSFLLVQAQNTNTLYFMDRVPQSIQLNPAFQPKCNLFIQMPGFATNFSVGNNSLSMSNLMPYNSKLDSLTWFMHDSVSQAAFINSLKDENKFFYNFQNDIIAFGFRVKTWYFSYNMSIKNDVTLSYPRDLAKLAIQGIGLNQTYNLGNFGINSTTYLETAFAASKLLNEDFTVGARFKILYGLFDISSTSNKFQIQSTEITDATSPDYKKYELSTVSDMTINAYLPYFTVPSDSTGAVKFSDIKPRSNPAKYLLPLSSKGIGIDLGATYNGVEHFVFSLSILDLGFINWRNSAYNLKMKGNFKFTGVALDLDSLDKSFSKITDSITNAFSFDKTTNNYTTSLPTRVYLGAEYSPIDYLSFGLLSLSQYYRSQFYQQVTMSANFKPLKMLALSASYSFFDNGFSNMGVGFSWCVGPSQFYFVSDNIPMRYGRNSNSGFSFIPYKMESLSFRLGMNFVFGIGNKKAMKDQPLLWE